MVGKQKRTEVEKVAHANGVVLSQCIIAIGGRAQQEGECRDVIDIALS